MHTPIQISKLKYSMQIRVAMSSCVFLLYGFLLVWYPQYIPLNKNTNEQKRTFNFPYAFFRWSPKCILVVIVQTASFQSIWWYLTIHELSLFYLYTADGTHMIHKNVLVMLFASAAFDDRQMEFFFTRLSLSLRFGRHFWVKLIQLKKTAFICISKALWI